MNNFILLNGKKYSTTHNNWLPRKVFPGRVRRTTLSNIDVTFGDREFDEWQGEIRPYHTSPGGDWGTLEDFYTALRTKDLIDFEDHFGVEHEVAIVGTMDPRSMAANYDAALNQYLIMVLIQAEAIA